MRNSLFWSVAAACVLLTAPMAFGQESADQQACLNKLNKDGAGVAKAQGKEHVSCLKKAGKGLVTGTVQACLTADAKGKVQKKKDKTTADQAGSCGTAPDFGFTSARAVNTGAVQGQLDIAADIFGDPIDGAVIDCAADKAGCICQQKALKDVEKLATTKLAEFVKCKKQVLKDGASSASSLEDCVSNAGTAGLDRRRLEGQDPEGLRQAGGRPRLEVRERQRRVPRRLHQPERQRARHLPRPRGRVPDLSDDQRHGRPVRELRPVRRRTRQRHLRLRRRADADVTETPTSDRQSQRRRARPGGRRTSSACC